MASLWRKLFPVRVEHVAVADNNPIAAVTAFEGQIIVFAKNGTVFSLRRDFGNAQFIIQREATIIGLWD